jgi:hypothetical protein
MIILSISMGIILIYKTRKLSNSLEGNTSYFLQWLPPPNNAFFEFREERLKN